MDAGVEGLSYWLLPTPKSGRASGIFQKPCADRKFPVHAPKEPHPARSGKCASSAPPLFDLLIAFHRLELQLS